MRRVSFAELMADHVLAVGDGYRAKSDELGGDGPIFLRAGKLTPVGFDWSCPERFQAHLADRVASKIGHASDTVITTKGNSVGRTGFVPLDAPTFVYSPHLSYWRSIDETKLCPDFLRYWAQGVEFRDQLRALAHGTDMAPYLSLADQRRLTISLPSIEIQRTIGAALGGLDNKIESNRRVVQLVLGLLDGLAEQMAECLPKTPLRELTCLNRGTVDPSGLGNDLVDHFSLPAFDAGARPDAVAANSIMSNKTDVKSRSVLVSRLNPRTNRTWWVTPRKGVRALASTEFACLVAPNDESLARLWLAVRDPSFRAELARRVTGTSGSHQRVRPDDLLAIGVPDARLMSTVVTLQALSLLEVVEQRRDEIWDLETLRDALLPELLSGRIRVPNRQEVA
jgi:type I restriction enzyme S subunit